MNSESILGQAKNIYFIGIGGIGISAIARMLLAENKQVSGSDSSESEITKSLEKIGAKIFIGQKAENIPESIDLFIYTVAVKEDNPEFIEAKSRGVKMMTYAETLNEISKSKYTIAVSGTHGKTTVTAMIAKVMIDAGLDPTVIVGSLIKDKNGEATNFIAGKSKYFVVEACEYERSFLNIEPKIAVINNIDADHLDYYGDLNGVIAGFNEFTQKVPPDGFVVCNIKLPNLKPIIDNVKCQIVDYGQLEIKEKLLVPGEHNRQNAKAALAVASILGIDLLLARSALSGFRGAWRRFEYKGKTKEGTIIYEDYAHNPQKIQAALQGAREMFPDKRIVVVFQPHLFSRTKLLLNEFAVSFNDADEVILAPIFPAREKFDPTISSEILAEEIKKHGQDSSTIHAFSDFDSIISYLKSTLGPNNVLITMGAGEQYKIGEALLFDF